MPPRTITEAEKARARKVYGTKKECPGCGVFGSIDALFGWRRMKPSDREVRPQAQCSDCRSKYAR